MRIFRCVALPFLVLASLAQSQVHVISSGDTTKIWDSGFDWNCVLTVQPMFPIVRWSQDTVYVDECDTSSRIATCICVFNTCTNLIGLQPGTYVAVVRRIENRHVVTPFVDTTLFRIEEAGTVTFVVSNTPQQSAGVTFYQSECSPDAVPYLDQVPGTFVTLTNYPNPFNPTTVVSGQWSVTSVVRLAVYDLLGKRVALLADGRYPAGRHTFTFDGSGLSSGIYLCRLDVEGTTVLHRMVLAK